MPEGKVGWGGRDGIRDIDGRLITPGEVAGMHRLLDEVGVGDGRLAERVERLCRPPQVVHPETPTRP
jgi:hypothetical protein